MKMIRYAVLITIFAFISTSTFAQTRVRRPSNPANEKAPTPMQISFPSYSDDNLISGIKVTPATYEGKVVLYYYFKPSCPDCVQYNSEVQRLQDQYGSSGLFTVICSTVDDRDKSLESAVKGKNFNFPVYSKLNIPQCPPMNGKSGMLLITHKKMYIRGGHPSRVLPYVSEAIDAARADKSLLKDVKLSKHRAILKVMDPPCAGAESAINGLRKKTNDEEAAAIVAVYDKWLEGKKSEITEALEKSPLKAIQLVKELKVIAPSIKEYDPTVLEIQKTPKMSVLIQSQSKILAFDKMIAKGKLPSQKQIDEIRKKVTPFDESEDKYLKAAASELNTMLDDISVSK